MGEGLVRQLPVARFKTLTFGALVRNGKNRFERRWSFTCDRCDAAGDLSEDAILRARGAGCKCERIYSADRVKVGDTFGKLTVARPLLERSRGSIQYLCICSCEEKNEVVVAEPDLRGQRSGGAKTSCGCDRNEKMQRIDLRGQRFGFLTVKSRDVKSIWLCECACKRSRKVESANLRNGEVYCCVQCARNGIGYHWLYASVEKSLDNGTYHLITDLLSAEEEAAER